MCVCRDTHGLLAQCDVVREKLQDFISVIKTEPVKDEQNESRNEEINENNNPPSPLPTAPSPETVRQSKVVVEEETATLRGEVSKPVLIVVVTIYRGDHYRKVLL